MHTIYTINYPTMTVNHNIPQDFYLPAEWEKQDAIQLTWPHANTDWSPYLTEITDTFLQLAKAISEQEHLIIATPDKSSLSDKLSKQLPESNMKNIIICQCDSNDTWARDHGAITLKNKKGDCILLDFKFNGWGDKFKAEKDNMISQNLHKQNVFNGKMVDYNDFVLEGGSIETDGEGTIFTTSCCLLAPHRNQPLSKADIENILKERLNAKRVVWLEHGELIGDDTDGHIDTIVRTAPNNTLLYMRFDTPADPQYNDFIELEKQLQTLKTSKGEPYRLLALPAPDAMYDEDDRLPATYANFVILNNLVIVPSYNQQEKDAAAKAIIQQAFPNHKVISIDASTVVRQHGSLHCLTMQYPQNSININKI